MSRLRIASETDAWGPVLRDWSASLTERGLADATRDGYLKHATWLMDAALAASPWDVTTSALSAWLDAHHWSEQTRRKVLVSLSALYAWGVTTDRIEWSPVAGIPRRAARRPGPARRPWPERWAQPVEGYIASLRSASRSEETIGQYLVRLHLLASLAADPWTITGQQLEQWLSNPDWSPQTKRSSRTAVASFYRWAVRAGLLTTSPAEELDVVRVPRGLPRPASDAAVRQALASADDRTRLALMLGAYAGLRRAEIARLRCSDLTETHVRVEGKGGHQRIVPVDPEGPLAEAWRAELGRRRRGTHGTGWSGEHVRADGWVFPSTHGAGPLTAAHLGKIVRDALPDGYTSHQLRHRFATSAYAAERDLMAVQQLLGHARPETTAIYARVPDGALLTAVRAAYH